MRRARSAFKSSEENYDPVMHRVMMLRFRPIAPKPAAGEAVSAALQIIGSRRKRKYVRVRGRKNTNTRCKGMKRPSPLEKSGVEEDSPTEKGVATLQPILERSENDKSCRNGSVQKLHEKSYVTGGDEVNLEASMGCRGTAAPANFRSVIKTWIIVECVTDAFMDSGVGLGLSDWERMNNLRGDTCPGFISDGTHNVVWINEAYRKMVAEEHPRAEENGIMVWLAVKEQLPEYSPAFACRVRMSEQTKEGYKWNRTLACDVWRMEFSGFAWKLDLNTALSLAI